MFPVLYDAGTWSISSYAFFAALGYATALFLTKRQARSAGFSAEIFSRLCVLCMVSGLIGARILFVLTNLAHFREHPGEIFLFWSGGLVFYGGFLLALPLCLLFLRLHRLPISASLDVLAPGLALGHAIGRVGCFAAGCCHGSYCPYPWGVSFHSSLVDPSLRGLPMHPSQLYESVGLLVLCGILLWASARLHRAGSIALVYLTGYAGLRFLVEIFRGDSARGSLAWAGGISTSQAIALGLLAAGGGLLLFRGFRRNQ